MNKKEVLEKVLRGYDVKVPDVLSNLNFSEIEEMPMKKESLKKKYIFAAVAYAAACLVILAAIPFIINTLKTPDDPAIPGADETLPEKDFGGEEFVVLGDYCSLSSSLFVGYEADYDSDPSVLAKEIAERNIVAESKYNIKIKTKTVDDPAMEVVKSYQCGQKDYSVVCDNGYSLGEAALAGYLTDISHISEIDLAKSYWMPHTVDDLTVSGKLYFLSGKLSVSPIEDADFLYYNMDIAGSLGKKDPFEMARDGEWNFDTFMDYVLSSEKDLDGDGKLGMDDRYSGLTEDDAKEVLSHMNMRIEDNGDGTYELIPYTEEELALYSKYSDAMRDINYNLYDDSRDVYSSDPYINKVRLFGAGRSMFFMSGDIYNYDMGDDRFDIADNMGLVPYPKTVSSSEYRSEVRIGSPLISIPLNCNNTEMTATVLEHLAASSESTLYPEYYKQYNDTGNEELNLKRTEMLDMIIDTACYNWTDIYMPEAEIQSVEDNMYASGSFGSVIKRYFKKIQDDVDAIVKKINSVPTMQYDLSTDEEDVIFGTKSLIMPFSGNMSESDMGRKSEIVYGYLYGLTSDDKIYTNPELTAVLEGDPTRLLAVTFIAFSSDGKDIIDADILREALVGDKDYPTPIFASSADYRNAVNGGETVIYMTGEDFAKLTPPEGMRVAAGLAMFPAEGGALSYLSTKISADEEVIIYFTYDHFEDDTDTADIPEDEWEAFEYSVKQYYDDSYLEECRKIREDGTLLEKLKKFISMYHDGVGHKINIGDFRIVPELCRVQMRVDKSTFIKMQDNRYIIARIVKEN